MSRRIDIYPIVKFNPTLPSVSVESPEEEKMLGGDWTESPGVVLKDSAYNERLIRSTKRAAARRPQCT